MLDPRVLDPRRQVIMRLVLTTSPPHHGYPPPPRPPNTHTHTHTHTYTWSYSHIITV